MTAKNLAIPLCLPMQPRPLYCQAFSTFVVRATSPCILTAIDPLQSITSCHTRTLTPLHGFQKSWMSPSIPPLKTVNMADYSSHPTFILYFNIDELICGTFSDSPLLTLNSSKHFQPVFDIKPPIHSSLGFIPICVFKQIRGPYIQPPNHGAMFCSGTCLPSGLSHTCQRKIVFHR